MCRFFPLNVKKQTRSCNICRTWVSDELVKDLCGDSYQCQYDYATTLSKEFAMFSKYYQDQFVNIYENVLKPESIVSPPPVWSPDLTLPRR